MKAVLKKCFKIIGIVLLVLIVLLAVLLGWDGYSRKKASEAAAAQPTKDPNALDFVVEDSDTPLEVPTSTRSELSDLFMIYEAEDYDLFFPEKHVTAADCKAVIRGNDAIPPRFKTLLSWYVDAIERHYPEADLRPLHYNLETLEISEGDDRDLLYASLNSDAYGCYVRTENCIYVKSDYEYVPQTWEYQVILHEFGHVARMVHRDLDDYKLRIQALPPESGFVIADEALNSLFTVSLFDYEELDIAYQFESNLFLLLLECLDGVDAGDYLNHSIAWFARAFDRQNGNNNYAMSLFRLIDAQYEDFHSDEICREQSVYYPIYDYVCRMYLDHYGAPDMTDEARRALVQELLDRLLYDVPEEFEIDTEEFFRFAEAYQIPA